MENKIYYIYHIPTFRHKDGRIGKIGCTEEEDAKVRVENQGYTEYEILETHTDIIIASDREIQLQKEYGYKVDTLPYYKIVKIATKESRNKGGMKNVESGHLAELRTTEHQKRAGSSGGKIGGPKGGKKNVETGHIQALGKKNVETGQLTEARKKAWEAQKKIITCPHCGKEGKKVTISRWHMERCKHKPTST